MKKPSTKTKINDLRKAIQKSDERKAMLLMADLTKHAIELMERQVAALETIAVSLGKVRR